MTTRTDAQKQAAKVASQHAIRVATAYLDTFSTPAGRAVLEYLTETCKPRRSPYEGMTMQETALFNLGMQSLLSTIQTNIATGEKARQLGGSS